MAETVIKVENVSKLYQLGTIGTGTLRKDFSIWWSKMSGKENPYSVIGENISSGKDHWALDDVSFEINEGDSVGIIGKNGAGKSTILKILSRITKPTYGQIMISGRIASLLEIGTGFHGELTGLENIFLNGAIMGLTRADVKARLDKIIDFSGIEEYINTPVKRYSSGMYVRLAFAVAAHLEPDILIVDEVLAVGDAEFQKKCTMRMNEVTQEGRTLLFVSHNMSAVRNLCAKALLFQDGKIVHEGTTDNVIDFYNEQHIVNKTASITWQGNDAPSSDHVRLLAIHMLDKNKVAAKYVNDTDEFYIKMQFECLLENAYLTPNFQLFDGNGNWILSTGNWASVTTGADEYSNMPYRVGKYTSIVKIPGFFLNKGLYAINALFHRDNSTFEFIVENAVSFHIVDTGVMSKEYMDGMTGAVRPRLEWKTNPCD